MSWYHEVVDLERRFWRAAGDPDFCHRHVADEAVLAFDFGLMSKTEVVAAMEGGVGWNSFTMDDLRVVEMSDNVASLSYPTVAVPAGSTDEYRPPSPASTSRRDGEWLLTLHQQTPVRA